MRADRPDSVQCPRAPREHRRFPERAGGAHGAVNRTHIPRTWAREAMRVRVRMGRTMERWGPMELDEW